MNMLIDVKPGGEMGSPFDTLVMLYEEAIGSMHRAGAAIEAGDVATRCRHIERAITIVTDLYAGLDPEEDGEFAAHLAVAYRLVLARLVLVNGRNDALLARGTAGLLEPILDAWRRIARESRRLPHATAAGTATASNDAAAPARVDRPAA